MTEPNEPIYPIIEDNYYVEQDRTVSEARFNGLTKREHFALEFAKSHLAGMTMASGENHHGWTYEAIAREGLYLADALILVLNEQV